MDAETHDLPRLPARSPDAHKGDAGRVAVFGGRCGEAWMPGAPALVARGAFRAGAGLVRICAPSPVLPGAVQIEPSATGVPLPTDGTGSLIPHETAELFDEIVETCDAIAVGPGLGTDIGAIALCLRAVQQEHAPVIVDADAINCLALVPELHRDFRARAVLTPHPGEFSRLASALRLGVKPEDGASRRDSAERLAQRLGCVVVLKGLGTVVSDGVRTWVCDRGHPCLATAGTGDVLTGVIAALAGQYLQAAPMPGLPEHIRAKMPADPSRPLDLFDVARLGVQAHAVAGELWAERSGVESGLLARELADLLPEALGGLRDHAE
ncbi:MAG: NAD(P)H-hydrate dehydratase [Phycisphaerales bacterium]|nr:NAD(P)H-hydrate dehydratase [Phycisphaerales bacterium]